MEKKNIDKRCTQSYYRATDSSRASSDHSNEARFMITTTATDTVGAPLNNGERGLKTIRISDERVGNG